MDKRVKVRIVRSDSKEFKIDGNDWKIPSNGLIGFGEYETSIATVDNAVGDGGSIESNRLNTKDRTIIAKSRNPLLNDILRREATSFFNSKFMYKIYITYMGVTRWCEGAIYKFACPTENVNVALNLTITFLCPNPYMKSFDDFGQNIASVIGMSGFPYLCSITEDTMQGITGGIYQFAKMITLENDGDADTYCKAVLKAKGEVVNPKLIINGNYVRVIDVMKEEDIIIIDFKKNPPTVEKNGNTYIGHCDRTSAFDDMVLIIGDSEVMFDADNGSNLLDVSIYYNKLYQTI